MIKEKKERNLFFQQVHGMKGNGLEINAMVWEFKNGKVFIFS